MIQMNYVSRCNCTGFKENATFEGCSSYLSQKMAQPLQIGETYVITYWVFLPKIYSDPLEPNITKHIGVTTSYYPLQDDKSDCLLPLNTLKSDSLLSFNAWHKLTWYIKPTCIQNYLTIGVFKQGKSSRLDKDSPNYAQLVFFIDDVSVTKLDSAIISNVKALSYCNYFDDSKEVEANLKNDSFSVYFDSNSELPKSTAALDSLMVLYRKKPEAVFLVNGYTDKKGDDNIALSEKRTEKVIDYLEQKGIPRFKFIPASWADKKPKSKLNLALNRRVDMVYYGIEPHIAAYRYALKMIDSNNLKEAFKHLNIWISAADDLQKILALFDPRTEKIRQFPQWKSIEKQIRNSYLKYKQPKLAFHWDSLYWEDQRHRRLPSFISDLGGYVREIDTTEWYFPALSVKAHELRNLELAAYADKLIEKHGYPKLSETNKRIAKSEIVILIHSLDTVLIKKHLPKIEHLCEIGEATWGYYAMLYDKLCTLQNRPQRFATQYKPDPKNPKRSILFPIESKESVNYWRKKYGIEPLNDFVLE